jgi:hypothetical protein
MAAGQPFDLEAELSQSLLREIDLSVFKWIFVAAADQERELIAIRPEELTEVEPIALRFVISHEACGRGEIEQAIVAVHGAMHLAQLGVGYMIAVGPHLPHSWHSLKQREGPAYALAGPIGKAAQHRRGIPRVGVPIREEPAIKNENSAYFGPTRGFTPL